MEYKGIYKIFDNTAIKTYPINTRFNKVKLSSIVKPEMAAGLQPSIDSETWNKVDKIAREIIRMHFSGKPVIVFSGAHLIKNGLGQLICDLVNRKIITLFAGNGATAIHDFELAMVGETSEHVPSALERGQFGMAYEFSYINAALKKGNELKLGYGESLGQMINDNDFARKALVKMPGKNHELQFKYPEVSILSTCFQNKIPCTIHAGIGTDVIDQHSTFNGEHKGGCSGRDFLIYTNEVCKMVNGGVILNIGSAVTGPEVLLKAISMAANTGFTPDGILTADFDMRSFDPLQSDDESSETYYYRDQKSVVKRIPKAFNGCGYYVKGNISDTVIVLYKRIMEYLQKQ